MEYMRFLKQKEEELKILTSVIQAVHKSSNLEEIYGIALDSVTQLENVDMTMIYLIDEDKREAVLQSHRNVPEDYISRAGRIPYPKGVTWKVINTGRMLNIEDAQKDPDIGPAGRDLGHLSILGIPIYLEEKVIGVIWFVSYKEHKFNENEVNLLTTLGDQIAIAIAKAKFYRELSKRNRYETIISTVTRSVHQSINLKEVLENAVESMSKNMDKVENVSVYLIEEEGAVLGAYRGYPDWFVDRVKRIPYPKGATWKTIIDGKPIYCADVDEDTVIGPAGREMGTKSYASMPIQLEGKTIGCIKIDSFQKNAFDEEELRLLEIVAQQIEIAINNAKQTEALRRTKEELELRVQERTKELSKINEELKKEITERKRAEERIKRSEAQLAEAQQIAHIGSWEWDIDLNKATWSDELYRIFGLKPHEIGITYEGFLERVHPNDRGFVRKIAERALLDHKPFSFDYRIIRPDRTVRILHGQGRVIIDEAGHPVRMIGTGQDITERKRAEKQLKASLREKEMLLKEIQHRVKNNLQIISSLLDLQSEYVKEKDIEDMFTEAKSRVRSMALVHEQLYQSKDLARIDFAEYIQNLIDYLSQSYGVKPDDITLKIKVDNISLDVNTAILCGLIINELVSNSLKHAFPKGRKGEISIGLRRNNKNKFILIVCDNGIGLRKGLSLQDVESLGLQIVNALTKQLGGTIKLGRSRGTTFKITWG